MICLSLKWRVSLWISTVLVAVIATISIVAYVEFEESHLRSIDRTLLAMANGILASLDDRQGEEELEEEVRAVTASSGPDTASFSYRIWMDGSSADLLASDSPDSEHGRWLRGLPSRSSPPPEESAFVNTGHPGDEYRVIWMRHRIDEGTVNIVVAGSSHFTFHELHEFLRLLLILGASLIVGSVVAIMWTVRCGLRPIDTTAKRLQEIAHPNVREAVFDEKKVPKELRPFVRALNDMLERLNNVLQRQKQFTSDAAHELRTPLAGAKSTLQAAQMHQRQPDEYKRAIHDALEDVTRMERLIGQLLALARMDEVGGQTITGEVQLDVLLGELADNYHEKAKRSGGKVIFENSSVATVRGDLDELVRLFSNVLDNAVRYGPPGGTVRIALKCEPDNFAAVCVHDSGGNIPPETLPRLFDRFYCVDHSRCNSTGGAGLGLAIAQEIVRRHNGAISITSRPESGTLVSIRLART
ncbi:MAG TPA: ATP-binding protein [Sedimentisphaerales bacterium]|nr:ATP-binding protein [Sedimentisphaerales bacterium]